MLRQSITVCAALVAACFMVSNAGAQTDVFLVPVATGPNGELAPGAVINGNEITLTTDGVNAIPVFLEMRIGDWDPNEIGDKLGAWQLRFNSASYTSGLQGALTPYVGPGGVGNGCAGVGDDAPCIAALGTGSRCDPAGYYLPSGTCSFLLIDETRPDYVYATAGAPIVTIDVSTLNVRPAGVVFGAAPDDPVPFPAEGLYAATIAILVPPDARGTFTIELVGFPDTQLVNDDSQFIKPIEVLPAKITILTEGCDPIAQLTGSSYACDDSLSRTGRNVLRFEFDAPITQPATGEIEIRELLPGGIFGPEDLSPLFNFSIEAGTTLRIEEDGCVGGKCDFDGTQTCIGGLNVGQACGAVLENEVWYAVMNTGNWSCVAEFQTDYAVVVGDANNDRSTGFGDLSAINASLSNPEDTPDDSRFDINAMAGVSFADLSAANAFIGSSAISTKPSGHVCPVIP